MYYPKFYRAQDKISVSFEQEHLTGSTWALEIVENLDAYCLYAYAFTKVETSLAEVS